MATKAALAAMPVIAGLAVVLAMGRAGGEAEGMAAVEATCWDKPPPARRLIMHGPEPTIGTQKGLP
jgi:hypothetical protein